MNVVEATAIKSSEAEAAAMAAGFNRVHPRWINHRAWVEPVEEAGVPKWKVHYWRSE